MLDEFGENNRANRKLVLQTPAGSIVPPHQLKNIVQQFKGCGCWTLKLKFEDWIRPASALALVCIFIRFIDLRIRHILNYLWNFSA